MKLNADATKATLAINAELNAHEVQELIRALAMLRAQMAPGVPQYPGASEPTITHDGPALIMDTPTNDELREEPPTKSSADCVSPLVARRSALGNHRTLYPKHIKMTKVDKVRPWTPS